MVMSSVNLATAVKARAKKKMNISVSSRQSIFNSVIVLGVSGI